MNPDEAKKYIGKEINLFWEYYDEVKQQTVEGSAGGTLTEIDSEGVLCLDWGYGLHVSEVTRIELAPD